MGTYRRLKIVAVVFLLAALGACASIPEEFISKPDVRLQDVQLMGLGFDNQTFLLSFDINNPNSFSLPVNHVSYGVRLDGYRFASGETQSNFSVPANGDASFAITVELDLLTTAPKLLSVMRDGVRGEIPYELDGRLGLDIPLAPAVAYSTNGAIRLNSDRP